MEIYPFFQRKGQKRAKIFAYWRILSRRIKGKMHFSLNLLLQNLEDTGKMPIFEVKTSKIGCISEIKIK